MGGLYLLADNAVARIARRWPDDVADDLARAWLGELAVLRQSPFRTATFVASLAVTPPVEAAGTPAVTWRDRAGVPLVDAVGLVLLAAGLFNLSHGHRVVLPIAIAGTAWLGARSPYRSLTVPLVGALMFAFLLAGNRVAVMPFMGGRDILPAVAVWTVCTWLAVANARFLSGRGRPMQAAAVCLIGSLVALEAAGVAGSLHAASVLNVRATSAPEWLPLAIAGHGNAAGLGVLVGNLAAMVGPLTLCSAYVSTQVLAQCLRVPAPVRWGALATATAVVMWSVAAAHQHVHDSAATALAGVARNSYVFGFGFATTMPGFLALLAFGAIVVADLRRTAVRST